MSASYSDQLNGGVDRHEAQRDLNEHKIQSNDHESIFDISTILVQYPSQYSRY